MADDISLVIDLNRTKTGYRLYLKAKSHGRTAWFLGSSDSVLGALEGAIERVRTAKRASQRGRIPDSCHVAADLRSRVVSK